MAAEGSCPSSFEEVPLVLTGATGLVGRAVLRRARGRSLRALVRSTASISPACAELHFGALPGAVPPSLFPKGPFVLVHLASATREVPAVLRRTNIEGTRRLLEATPSSCLGVLYGSSVSVYGGRPLRGHDETAPVRPRTALARTRAEAERLVLRFAAARNLPAYLLRTRMVVGRGDRHTLPRLLELARSGRVLGDGAQRCSVVDVEDLAEVVLRLAGMCAGREAPAAAAAMHVAYRRPLSHRALLQVLAEVFELPAPAARVPVSRWRIAALRCLPSARARALASELELGGTDRFIDVSRLAGLTGEQIVGRDPEQVIRQAALRLRGGDER